MHLIDTHAHLDYPDFRKDLEEVIDRAHEAEVKEIITIGTSIASSQQVVKLSHDIRGLWGTVGIHPSEAQEVPDDFIDQLKPLAKDTRVVAVGEIGLDYHHLPSRKIPDPLHETFAATVSQDPESLHQQIADDAYKNQQIIVFREQLDLAVEIGRNVVIHQRDAWDDTMDILSSYSHQTRAVFHCFTGTLEEAMQIIDMGHLISFTGIATFKNAEQLHETIRGLPDGKFMVETDCPYLAPHPYRGKRCEPAYTRLVAQTVADLRETSLESIAEQTTTTARSFFGL